MIDELDRIMTVYGTISVKTPDVWGQDRLAKFRSEYESQMAVLKAGFKPEINASIRRSETKATRVQIGTESVQPASKGATSTSPTAVPNLATVSQAQARAWTRACRHGAGPPTRPPRPWKIRSYWTSNRTT